MSKLKTKDEFVQDARAVHGDRYDYSLVVYTGNKVKVHVICRKHGGFSVKPNGHISNMSGCPACYRDEYCWTTESIIEAFQKKHKDKYDYKDVVFVRIDKKVKIWCRECQQPFFSKGSNHLFNGTGCPRCFQIGAKNPIWNPDREMVQLRTKIHRKVKGLIGHTLSGVRKEDRSHNILGWTRADLLKHIVSHQDWENCVNNGDWQIDHILPVAAFVRHGITNPKIINHLSNLRPMLPALNMQKNDKYDEGEFLEWIKKFPDDELRVSYDDVVNSGDPRAAHKPRRKKKSSSKYVGVQKPTSKSGWYSWIGYQGKRQYLGYFLSEEDAAKHYDYFCLKYYGQQPNFPGFDYSQFTPICGERWFDKTGRRC